MNKNLILIAGVLVLLALAGCDGKQGERPITDVDVRVGTEGLTMEFMQNAPPERVFEENIFPIAIELKNKGAFDIVDNEESAVAEKVKLVFGFEDAYVEAAGGDEKCDGEVCRTEINGKSVYNPAGDDEFLTIDARAKKIGAQSETHASTIRATVCYPYKTVLGSSVCIDPDVYGVAEKQKACNVEDMTFEGQGAPVAVTKIEPKMLPSEEGNARAQFIIYIKNKGNGEVTLLDRFEDACGSQESDDDLYREFYNRVKVNAWLSGEPLVCNEKESDLIAVLKDKEAMIMCTYDGEGSSDAYTAALRVELDYGYTFTISKDIIIEKILTY
jgi:hypothetical protein